MSQQLQITGGAKVRDLQDVIIGTSGVLSSLAFNVANGVPKLDVNGKILVSQLPNSVMEYLGTWDASTNTPTLVNGTGNQGDVYLCNVAGTTNFGAGPITFAVGDSAIYSGTIWQKAGGATGTVTSVGLTSTGNDAITITGSPITTSGNINLGFAGTSGQYINGAGNLTTFPTLISSIGLSMPSAFSVSNSPLTANGTIAVTGAGYPSQYIRGDGTLADFPTSGGGGSSVSYYLNGGTSQGTIGGVTYYEMSKTADTGTGVDFPKTGDGLIVSFLTDAGDPAQLNIPAGNWNYEIYASMSANGGTPQMYAELYVYNGTTFTLIATSSNEILYDGVNLNLYTFAMTVPATTLTLTDRLAVKLYATNSGGKTTTVHTQDSHLCQIITTFSTGITALNGLTAQVQYFATGTSGTDFNISSTTATHTFNIPDASATARGLITTGTQTIAGGKTFSGYTSFTSTSGTSLQYGAVIQKGFTPLVFGSNITNIYSDATTNNLVIRDNSSIANLVFNNSTQTYTFPAASGTIALTSNLSDFVTLSTYQTITANKTFSGWIQANTLFLSNSSSVSSATGFGTLTYNKSGSVSTLRITNDNNATASLIFDNTTNYNYTFPSASGTVALSSDLGSYVPLAGNVNVTGPLGINTTGGAGTTGLTNFGTFITRSDSTQGFPRKLAISMASGTLVSIDASGNGANYITDMAFSTSTASGLNGTPAIYITGTNNRVGIKTGTPAYDLDVSGTGRYLSGNEALRLDTTSTAFDTSIRFYNNNSATYWGGIQAGPAAISGGGMNIYNNGAYPMAFNVNGAERMRITSGGNLLIGTSTDNAGKLQVNGEIRMYGSTLFRGMSSNTLQLCGGTSSSNVLIDGSVEVISMTTNGAERMRITSGGVVCVGTTAGFTSGLVCSDGGTSFVPFAAKVGTTTNAVQIYFNNPNGVVGSINTSGSATAYNTSSDYRLKQDLKDYNGLDLISAIKTYDYEWKSDNTRAYGVMAHELSEVIPYVVNGDKDAVDEEGNIKAQGVDYSKLVPVLVKAIQEQNQLIEDLKSRLDKAGL